MSVADGMTPDAIFFSFEWNGQWWISQILGRRSLKEFAAAIVNGEPHKYLKDSYQELPKKAKQHHGHVHM